jgi:hypothetical protein
LKFRHNLLSIVRRNVIAFDIELEILAGHDADRILYSNEVPALSVAKVREQKKDGEKSRGKKVFHCAEQFTDKEKYFGMLFCKGNLWWHIFLILL